MNFNRQTLFAGFIFLAVSVLGIQVRAQEKVGSSLEFDRTVCDFGDILTSDGPVSCEFKMTNISDNPVVIYSVTTSCGCTVAKWSKEPIMPGKSTKIGATFSNDQGPYPFDKVLTVYTSAQSAPILLKLRGVVREAPESLDKMYPEHLGKLGLRDTELKGGNLEMGNERSDVAQVANLSNSPLDVEFTNPSQGLSISVSPNPIPAKETATMSYTIKSERGIWGRNTYYATPVVGGKEYKDALSVTVFTKENFSDWTEAQKKAASNPMFNATTCNIGKVKAGSEVHASWTVANLGKSTFKTYKVDTDNPKAKCSAVPDVEPGETIEIDADLDTSGIPDGELLVIVTLTTNSPKRPLVNLFIAGWIE